MSRSPRRAEEEVSVPPILKFNGLIKGPIGIGMLAADSQRDLPEGKREEEHLAKTQAQQLGEENTISATGTW